jgi:hypothetical protein
MAIWLDIIYVLGAYCLGSVPHLAILAGFQRIRLEGDSHASLWQKGKKPFAVIGIILEFVKGAAIIWIGKALGGEMWLIGLAGLAGVCGQMWPVFQQFNGEKGNTIGLGMAAAFTPLAVLPALAPVITGVLFRIVPRIWRNRTQSQRESVLGGPYSYSMPLGMIGGFIVLPISAGAWREPLAVVLEYCGLVVLLLVRRLTAGLKQDLRLAPDFGQVWKDRLLFDRGWIQTKNSKPAALAVK